MGVPVTALPQCLPVSADYSKALQKGNLLKAPYRHVAQLSDASDAGHSTLAGRERDTPAPMRRANWNGTTPKAGGTFDGRRHQLRHRRRFPCPDNNKTLRTGSTKTKIAGESTQTQMSPADNVATTAARSSEVAPALGVSRDARKELDRRCSRKSAEVPPSCTPELLDRKARVSVLTRLHTEIVWFACGSPSQSNFSAPRLTAPLLNIKSDTLARTLSGPTHSQLLRSGPEGKRCLPDFFFFFFPDATQAGERYL